MERFFDLKNNEVRSKYDCDVCHNSSRVMQRDSCCSQVDLAHKIDHAQVHPEPVEPEQVIPTNKGLS